MPIVEIAGETFSVHKDLYNKWMQLRDGKLTKVDDDKVYVVDGRERSGKSVFAMQQIATIDPTIIEDALRGDTSRICFTAEAFLNAVRNTKSTKTHTKVVWFDEAFRGLASTSVLSKTNKLIVQAMMEMGQNNLVLFIVLPSFFLLDRYPAVLRSNALFHIQKEKNSNRRGFYVYNYSKKANLYHLGIKKGWSYPVYTKFRGQFYNKYPGGKEFEKIYRDKKLKVFKEIEEKMKDIKPDSKFKIQRDLLFYLLHNDLGWPQKNISEIFPAEYDDIKIGLKSSAVSGGIKSAEKILKALDATKKQKIP